MLRATTACNFASLLWPAGSAPAALASLLFQCSGKARLQVEVALFAPGAPGAPGAPRAWGAPSALGASGAPGASGA